MNRKHFIYSLFLAPLAAVVGKRVPIKVVNWNATFTPGIYRFQDIRRISGFSGAALERLKRDMEDRWIIDPHA